MIINTYFRKVAGLTLFCSSIILSHAEESLRPARIFSDNMVLQQGSPVPVWGTSAPNEKVTVEYAGQRVEIKSDQKGKWKLNLNPLRVNAEPKVFKVSTEKEDISFRNVIVGEVWFSGGQSNMGYNAGSMAGRLDLGKRLVSKADYPNVRFRKVTESNSPEPKEDLGGGSWFVCNSNSVKSFSAVGFIYARRLHLKLKVPVGIIDCSWGGTPIEPYIPAEAFTGHPTLEKLLQYAKTRNHEAIRKMRGGTFVRSDAWVAGAIYNSRIAPVAPYAVRGFTWYQAESNCGTGEDPRDYAHKMRALIRGWRGVWANDDLPFYYVQLPQWKSYAWTYAREEQSRALDVPGTGMAVTIDLDINNDIHPPNKIDVGERLALLSLKNDYKFSVTADGPIFESAQRKGDSMVVHFKNAEDDLMVGKSEVGEVLEVKNDKLYGFELADKDGVWHPAHATIQNGSVIVSQTGLKGPKAVRYACHPQCPKDKQWNLYNRAKLPASPFCSDWSLMKYDPDKNPMPN
ncbi:sialate O-acetylesterase [Verrucomicrobiales bacterium]|nr:sialate O-acetylesterase [Verrucomicrobiales bacterium]